MEVDEAISLLRELDMFRLVSKFITPPIPYSSAQSHSIMTRASVVFNPWDTIYLLGNTNRRTKRRC